MSTLLSYFKTKKASSDCNPLTARPEVKDSDTDESEEVAPKVHRKRYLIIESDNSEEEESSLDSQSSKRQVCAYPARSAPKQVDKPPRNSGDLAPTGKKTIPAKVICNEGSYAHNQLKWLQAGHLKDKYGHHITHPDYDPKTLCVPGEYFRTLTPGFQQWWTIKADNFDSIIMFKVGKFYELYHMDAVIGVRELGLVFMKSDFAHCGFPEVGFGRYSDTLIQKGFKVVRVEQVETPARMEQRIKEMDKVTKSDRVVRREVCSVLSKGTRTLSFFSEDDANEESIFLLAIKEVPISESIYCREFGVCFVDTCIGIIHLGQFQDDGECSRLRTLFAHYPPGHVLYERKGLHSKTQQLIKLLLPSCIMDILVPDTEFWDGLKTLKILAEGGYFEEYNGAVKWPLSLEAVLGSFTPDDKVCFSVSPKFKLAVSALGACVWCLRRAHIDFSILSLARFQSYDPLDSQLSHENCESIGHTMILDDVTLTNLDIVASLLEKLDSTSTAFGKRLLRQWVCSPLTSIVALKARQGAVQGLLNNPALMAEAKSFLRKIPDLERLLHKIHSQGCQTRAKDHPDSRAIFFEHMAYSRRKISDFVSILDGLRMSLKVMEMFGSELKRLDSTLLSKLFSSGKNGHFPDLEEQLAFYENSFNRAKALKEGTVIPTQGVSVEYDTSEGVVTSVLQELDQYLSEQKKRLKCKSMAYWGTGRNRFQLEVPIAALTGHSIPEYELSSQKKGFRRYRTPAIEEMLKRLTAAEERRDKALKDVMEQLFYSFDQHWSLWENAVRCIAVLDVLISLATYSLSEQSMCCPVFLEASGYPVLHISNGRHPCILHTHNGGDFIPNDVVIDGKRTCLLVTGPNMGGKSTLMRQTGLIVVLAHLGCFVPATECRLSPVDRVFTRMGACDKITARQSTFFVELKETCSILHHATWHSLVLVDELGRGTATYDGAAIACAVVQQLAQEVRCRALFSTHYHFLVDQFENSPCVQLGYMACVVEREGEEECITFLYKLTEGACPNSYGFNVAQLAGLPASVVAYARKKASVCERETAQIRQLRMLFESNPTTAADLKRLLAL